MTQNLKIEVLTGDISIDGMVVTNLVTKEELSTAIVKKADLGTDGKIPINQLPAEIVNTAGIVDEVKLQLETSIKDAVDESNAYAESYTDNAVSSKADLTSGKVPLEQLPAIDQYPQFGTALSNLSTSILTAMKQRTDELEKTKADLGEDGKVLREQIPSYEKISGLPEQLEVMSTQTAAVSGELDQHKLQTADRIDVLKENIEANVQQLTDRQSYLMRTYVTKDLGVDAKVGVKPGEYFYVRSQDEEEMMVEYQNIGGVPTPSGKSYPSSAAVNLLKYTTGIKDPFSGLTQDKINSYSLTPFHFGAIGDGMSHKLSERYTTILEAKSVYPHAISLDDEIDWCALIKFFMAFKTNVETHIRFDWSGKFVINKPLSLISTTSSFIKSMFGDIKLALNNFGRSMYVLRLHGRGLNLQATTITINAAKLAKYGILVGSRNQEGGNNAINFGLKLGSCFIDNARIDNIHFSNGSMFNSIDFYRGGTCGAIYNDHNVGTNHFRPANVTAQSQYINTESIFNRTNLIVDKLPEESLSDTPIFIHYNNQVARIESIDTSTNRLGLHTLILLPEALGELHYIYGACISTAGADSAGVHIKQMSTFGSGIALRHEAAYPCVVDYLCSEFSGIAVVDRGLVAGPCVSELYLEGDKWQYFKDSDGRPYDGGANFRHATAVEIDKWVDASTSQTEGGVQYFAGSGAQGLVMYEKGVYHSMPKGKYTANRLPTSIANGLAVNFNLPHQNYTIWTGASITVGFTKINPQYNRLFAYDSQEMTIFGTSNGGPSGTVTLVPPSGYTLNGSSNNLTFSGFTGAAHFRFYLQVQAKNIIVDCTSLIKPLDESATSLIPSGVTDVRNLPVGKFWFDAGTSITGLPTSTTGVVSNGNIKTYFSYAKVGQGHRKTQFVEYPDLFETWSRVFNSVHGSYGAWKLISYETKKGTTAQRPSNPQLGMRYYDTTLLATGKPIEYNGTAWVDMSGVVV